MKRVGVRNLKNQLSLYLRYVKEGETVIITERDKIIAEINLPGNTGQDTAIEEKLKQLGQAGEVIPAKRNKSYAKVPAITEKVDWLAAYNETRNDRRKRTNTGKTQYASVQYC